MMRLNTLLHTAILACLLAAPLQAQDLDTTRANLHSAYDTLMQSLAEQETLAKEITRLNDEVAAQRKKLEPDTQRVADLRAKAEQAKASGSADLQAAEMRLKVAEIEYSSLSEGLTTLEKSLADANARMKTLETGTSGQISKVQELRKQVASLAEKDKQDSARRDAAQSAEMEKIKGELITLRISVQEAEAEKTILSQRASELQSELEQLKQSCATTAAAIPANPVDSTPASSTTTASTAVTAAPAAVEPQTAAPAAIAANDVAAELAARLKDRNMDKAVSKSGRYLYIKTMGADGQTRSQTFPWLTVDKNYYTLEAEMKAGQVTLTFGNQRQEITVPATDDGATYVFVLRNANKDDASIAYYRK